MTMPHDWTYLSAKHLIQAIGGALLLLLILAFFADWRLCPYCHGTGTIRGRGDPACMGDGSQTLREIWKSRNTPLPIERN